MDFNSLKNTVSNLTLYDVKAGVRQLQNAVMNYTEMEAKVREATNNEPWGASSTTMQEIANGTFNYQLLNEIMPMIYHRFTEKTAEQWRQIYKALQLLEFLIKNGSERVIDDARSHLSLLKMLRQFHFIDANGKDQGINVRNRSKELTDLLSDVEKIRQERKKARGNRQKYSGYEGGGGLGGGLSSAHGGFGSGEGGSYGGYDGRVYGDGGGFGGNDSGFSDTQTRRDDFEEYDENADAAGASGPSRRKHTSANKSPSSARRTAKKAEPAKAKEPEVDLFDFGDEPTTSAPSISAPASGLADLQGTAPVADDDDFDDFQSAPITASNAAPTQSAAPQPISGAASQNMNDLFSSISPPPGKSAATSSAFSPASSTSGMGSSSAPQFTHPTSYQPTQPNYFTSVQGGSSNASTPSIRPSVATTPGGLGKPIGSGASANKPAAGGDAFAGLLGGMSSKKAGAAGGKVSMADMARQKASAGIWGASNAGGAQQQQPQQHQAPAGGASQPKAGGGLDDLLG